MPINVNINEDSVWRRSGWTWLELKRKNTYSSSRCRWDNTIFMFCPNVTIVLKDSFSSDTSIDSYSHQMLS